MTGTPTTAARVRAILIDQLGVETFPDSAHIITDLGADSLDTVELVMRLEEAFGVEIETEDMDRIDTVANLIALVERLVAA